MARDVCNILIGGEAGQGLVTVGSLLSRLLVRRGYDIVVTQDYMSRIRGGHNTFEIRAGARSLTASQHEVDLLVALDAATISINSERLSKGGVILAEDVHSAGCSRCLAVPYKELSNPRYSNIVALGVISSLLGIELDACRDVVHHAFGKKDPSVVEENETALARAFEWAGKNGRGFEMLSPAQQGRERLMMNGNDAIALGAMSAGVKFYSFYPMTPSTSVGLNLAANAKRMGIIVEQAEDEIAAINMAIGASFAGAPSMVSTSGGGFALMVEGVSLAAMTETPIVIMVGQRPAPATGLPTRTEQADLEFVLHSGHGEFPRAIFAPGTVEQCFHLTRKAFELAEASQGPVFILSDQFLADSDRAVDPFDIENLPPVKPGVPAQGAEIPYKRFKFSQGGVSPRLLPGMSEHLVVVDSDEHTEDGHITEDLSIRKAMVEKRLAKMELIRRESVPPSYSGEPSPDLLMVCWGSTLGSALEAQAALIARGTKAAVLHFSQAWPLVSEQFIPRLSGAKQVVCIEGNATAQFARLIRRESGFEIKRRILRYDGLPITPEYILRELDHG